MGDRKVTVYILKGLIIVVGSAGDYWPIFPQVFSEDQSGDMTFSDFLDMLSVMSMQAPKDLKAAYAFKVWHNYQEQIGELFGALPPRPLYLSILLLQRKS